ncbi:cancer/testis antigen 55-like [Tupaia chinensis]|uniref:cancer/testis antigen 55-like n=1 Tax=Tupaia chinensis TaxID=246437 RepID=UPI0003C8CC90|nr:cancer/testis antigen 55-like [Tupaia chinensis]
MVVLEEEETAFELKAIKVDVLCDGMEDSGLSDFGTRVITGCVTSVSRDAVYVDEKTSFSLDSVSEEVLCDGMEDSGLSDFGTRVITGCVTSVSRDAVYVDEKTSFSLDSVSEAFMPYKGDWIEVEYSIVPGAKNIKVHSAKPLFCRHLEEVCITSLHGRNGVVNGIIFFTLDSLELPDGYKPQKHDIVNVDAVESVQSCYIWRAVSMTPVQNSL